MTLATGSGPTCGETQRRHMRRSLGHFEITLGSSRAKLNLKTGSVDVPDVNDADLDRLRLRYAEHKFLAEIREAGATVHHREVSAKGDIVITYKDGLNASDSER
jgi:hypothetical protein